MYGNGYIYGNGKKVGLTLILIIGFVASASGAPNPTCLSSQEKQTIKMLTDDEANVSASDVEQIFISNCNRDTTFYSILQDDQDQFLNSTMDKVDGKLEDAKNDIKVYVNEQTSLGRVTKFLQGLNTTIQSQKELDDQIDSLEKEDKEIKKDLADYYVRQSYVDGEINTTEEEIEQLRSDMETQESTNQATGMFSRVTTQFWGVLALVVLSGGGLLVASDRKTPIDKYWKDLVSGGKTSEMSPERQRKLQNMDGSQEEMKSMGKLEDEREASQEEEQEEDSEKIQTYEIDGEIYTEDGLEKLKESLTNERDDLQSKGATRTDEEDERLEEIKDKITTLELNLGA
mgnify:CR=1 FL=1